YVFSAFEWQFQSEGGAASRAVAFGSQGTAHPSRGERARGQPEAVAFHPGGKPMPENPGQVFGGQTDSVVRDRQADPALRQPADADANHPRVRAVSLAERLSGVSQEIQQNLEYVVFLGRNCRQALKIPLHLNPMPDQSWP